MKTATIHMFIQPLDLQFLQYRLLLQFKVLDHQDIYHPHNSFLHYQALDLWDIPHPQNLDPLLKVSEQQDIYPQVQLLLRQVLLQQFKVLAL